MRIAERDPIAVQQTEVEAEHDLPVAVALPLVEPANRLESLTLDVLRDKHPARRELRVDRWHGDERMAAAQPLDPSLVLRLELVVELLDDPLAQLGSERLRIEAWREPLDQRQQQHRVTQVGLDRLRHPRILDLDDHFIAVERRRPVHLADRRRRESALVELGEDAAEWSAELLSHQPLEL